jgi:LAS superfamily LD-carboxypeptidase LdcB
MKKFLIPGALAAMTLTASMCGAANDGRPAQASVYGTLSAGEYLEGRFEPSSNPQFVPLASLGIAENNGPHYLRREAAGALAEMFSDFRKEHPTVRIFVQSSTRNFDSQKSIWNAKFRGERLVGGRNLKKSMPDISARAREILKFSSMPGTSRHHWGSDFDINTLTNSYYEKGEGKIIFEWLTANASRYGFARPYTAGRTGGYEEERWHWSYLPLSKRFLADWLSLYGARADLLSAEGLFDGSPVAGAWARSYVETINPECR